MSNLRILAKHLQGRHNQQLHAPKGKRRSGGSSGSFASEPKTPPPPGPAYVPNVTRDADKDGLTDAARVGVPANQVPPPPSVGKLPNLTPDERKVESDFIKAYEKNPDKMADNFLAVVKSAGSPPTFGTDDAKVLASKWSDPNLSLEERSKNRAIYNLPLHQTANAIAKRSFVKHLDSLKPGDEVLVTVGGVGAGKGYALKNVPAALQMKSRSKAVWDSAGDQNATENAWIQKELNKRGLKGNYVYVHSDPKVSWAHPDRGVVQRAKNPADGRMVDSKVFADSYTIGAQNHQKFYEANRNNPNASFAFLDNRGTPKLLEGMPKEALNINRDELYKFAVDTVKQPDVPPHIQRGGSVGERIWADE